MGWPQRPARAMMRMGGPVAWARGPPGRTGRQGEGTCVANGAYASVNGLRLYYEVHGEGRPLVLLHGGLMTIDLTFGRLLPDLARTHRVIAVELQGHGRTADSRAEIGIDLMAEDVAALLGQVAAGPADLFGHSLGGAVALQTALRHPDAVRRLVLASTSVRPGGSHAETSPGSADFTSPRMPTAADFQAMEATYRELAPDPAHWPAFAAKAAAMVGAFPGWSTAELAGLQAPSLILVGDSDFVRLEHAVEMLSLLPGAQLAVLPGCTHMDVPRRREQVLALVEPFLGKTA
jgi:pimeloyl-ACP methyl ester carboxylesterase